MFNIGSGEIALIAVVALLLLGPSRLPELARGIGKFMREFRRQTDEVRGVVEREFYKMDSEIQAPPVRVLPAQDLVPKGPLDEEPLPAPDPLASQLTAGTPETQPVPPKVTPPAEPPASGGEVPTAKS